MTFPSEWERLPSIPCEPRTRVKLPKLSKGLAGDFTAPVSGSINRRIVMDNNYPVGCDSDIELNRISPGSNCLCQRLDCVLRSVSAITAVTNDRACFGVEQNVHLQKITGRRP